MAKDDYEVIACKILVYFYRKMKGKISPEEANYYLYPQTPQFPITQEYLINDGYIADANITRAWGGDVALVDTDKALITIKGIEFLRENSTMRKIAETLKEAIPIWSLFS